MSYASLLRNIRRDLHNRAGTVLQTFATESHDDVEAIANHFYEGENWGQAAAYKLRGAEKALGQFSIENAITLGTEALECSEHIEDGQEWRRKSLELLGDSWSYRGDMEQANTSYDAALAICEDANIRTEIANKRHNLRFVDVEGARLGVYQHGSGNPCLLLVSPDNYDVAMYQPLIQNLCQDHTVMFVAPRGIGASSGGDYSSWSVSAHVRDLCLAIDKLGIAPVVAIGISRGGNTALKIATEKPGLIGKIMLCSTPVDDHLDPDSRFPVPVRFGSQLAQAIKRSDSSAATRAYMEAMFSEEEVEDYIDEFMKIYDELPLEWVREFWGPQPDRNLSTTLRHSPLQFTVQDLLSLDWVG